MKFLVPVGGVTDSAFGVLTSYKHKGIPVGIRTGLPWAADNCAFSNSFDPHKFTQWLEKMTPYRDTCLFVVVPDKVGDCGTTLALWHEWRPKLNHWPLAFVCQDGQAPSEIPLDCDAIFIGGSTGWKTSSGVTACIQWAQTLAKSVHIGRVNWGKRYAHFRIMKGSEHFTCDGTRTRFDGTERTLAAWKQYMGSVPLLQLE
jgi:hypothetical protein